ncbi:restriction endonuclease subunit S [Pseudomonas putida]|nr:restriction endonuclease subunit S [Pseudomonas putida]
MKHGFAFKGEHFVDEKTSYQLTTPGNFSIGGGFQCGKGKYYSGPVPGEYILSAGDLIVTMTDLSKKADTLGYTAVIPETAGTTWLHNQRVGLVRPRDGSKICMSYIHYLMRSPAYRHLVVSTATGSTVKHTSPDRILAYEFSLPTLSEQKQIGEMLSSLDDRITLLRETNATLEAIAQALFKSWFVDFEPVRAKAVGLEPAGMDAATAALFPDGLEESELGLVPMGWRGASLADLANFQNGYAFKSKDWVAAGHPVVKIGDVKPGVIDLAGCSFVAPETTIGLDRFKLERGSLLVGMTGYVGETGLVPTVTPSAYLNQRVGRFSTNNGLSDLGFVYCIVRNPAFKVFAEAQSHGSAQANVSGTALAAYPTVMPSNDLFEKFNEVIAPILESILSNHEQAQTLTQLRDTLLPRLISGQLRLPETEAPIENLLSEAV